MNNIERIQEAWRGAMRGFEKNPLLVAVANGTFTAEHYAMFLRELFHNTHENPEGLAFMAGLLKGEKRRLNKKLFRHSQAESGHDQMAAADLAYLGYDARSMQSERALVTTEAFSAFPIFQAERRHPLAYLGYLYHLEQVAVEWGPKLVAYFRSIGIPLEAMSFLVEHSEADVGHSKLNEEYIRELVTTEEDVQAYIYGLRGAVRLHGLMLQGVMEAVDGDWPEWRSLQRSFRGTASPARRA